MRGTTLVLQLQTVFSMEFRLHLQKN